MTPVSVRITNGTTRPPTVAVAASGGGAVGSASSWRAPAPSTYCHVTSVGASQPSSGVDGARPKLSVVQAYRSSGSPANSGPDTGWSVTVTAARASPARAVISESPSGRSDTSPSRRPSVSGSGAKEAVLLSPPTSIFTSPAPTPSGSVTATRASPPVTYSGRDETISIPNPLSFSLLLLSPPAPPAVHAAATASMPTSTAP